MKKDHRKFWFCTGLLLVLCQAVPFLVLGQETVVNYHDQLDGEMVAYILQARHLFQGGNLPEFLGGVSKTALLPPAPLFVLLFLTGHYFAAYVIMQMIGCLTGYIGMFLLAGRVTDRKWIAAMAGVLFAYLPFLPVYGLSQFGIPLLLWCFLQMREGRFRKAGPAFAVFFAAGSSLVLSGFGVLGILIISLLYDSLHGRKTVSDDKKSNLSVMWLAWGLMLITYAAENLRLFYEMFSGAGESHKAEYILTPSPLSESFQEAFLKGGQHSADYHIYILAAVVLAVFWATSKGKEGMAKLRKAGMLLGWIILLAFAAAGWNSAPVIALRERMQALGAFQADRVLWISPVFWYLLSAWAMDVLADNVLCLRRRSVRKILSAMAVISMILGVGAMGLTGLLELKNGNWKANLYRAIGREYQAIGYSEYYAVGVLEQVEQYIRENTGRKQSDYRVISLGIDPAAAYYHGFYCLDGYSNNYPLEYKHRFRKIIAPELEKSDYLKDYFDQWGNRCYLLSAECPAYYTVEKNGFFFQDYEVNVQALKDMGGRYILSAAYIVNAQNTGLTLVREEPFETRDSYYRIFLYEME